MQDDRRAWLAQLGEEHLRDLPVRQEVAALVVEVHALRRGAAPQPQVDPTGLLDVRAAAARIGLSTSTLYKLAAAITIPSVKFGSRLMFKVTDLDAFIEQRRRSPERVAGFLRRVPTGAQRARR